MPRRIGSAMESASSAAASAGIAAWVSRCGSRRRGTIRNSISSTAPAPRCRSRLRRICPESAKSWRCHTRSSTSTTRRVRTSRAARVCAAMRRPTAAGHAVQAISSRFRVSPGNRRARISLLARSIMPVRLFYQREAAGPNVPERTVNGRGRAANPVPRDNRAMPVIADVLRAHIDYTAWASQRLVDAAAELSEEELVRDFRTSERSVLGTLVHVFAADRIWLWRLAGGGESPGFVADADYRLAVLQNDWPALQERWRLWADGRVYGAAGGLQGPEGECAPAAAVATGAARSQSRHPPPRAGLRNAPRDGPRAAAARSDRLLPAIGRGGRGELARGGRAIQSPSCRHHPRSARPSRKPRRYRPGDAGGSPGA